MPQRWPLSAYQNVYAAEPGSAEMPSAGRPFTPELITRLVTGGVLVAPITLHTGVSSQERHEPPYPERFRVPRHTANLVNAVHEWGGRVIAVGTTVVRALETVSQPDGNVAPDDGWTNLVVTAERGLWTIDGLLTGLHEPESSHLEMLLAAAGEGCSSAATRPRSSAATAGTSSATATSSFPDHRPTIPPTGPAPPTRPRPRPGPTVDRLAKGVGTPAVACAR